MSAISDARFPAAELEDQAPNRDERPDPFEQKEAPLPVKESEEGKNRRSGRIQGQVAIRPRIEQAVLTTDETGKDQDRADQLKYLIQAETFRR